MEQEPNRANEQPLPALVWEAEMPLLGHPLVLRQLLLGAGLSVLIMGLLLTFPLAVQGEWDAVPAILLLLLCATLGVVLLMALVSVVVFRNRVRLRYSLDARGVVIETLDKQVRRAARLATLAGLLSRHPTAAGAGLLASARQSERLAWRGISEARYDARRRTIALRNGWRTVGVLICTPDNYAQVESDVRARVAALPQAAARRANPLPRLLLRTLLVVVAALPVFVLPYPFELDLLLPLTMLSFALATVWLVHLFGWVVIASALLIAAQLVARAVESHESIFPWRATYRTYEFLDAADWMALAAVAVGLGYLIAYSWRAARGRHPSALASDVQALDDEGDRA